MRKIGTCLAVAALIIGATTATSKPAKADGGTTAAIITAVITGTVTVLTLVCKDAAGNQFLCIKGPPKAGTPSAVCGVLNQCVGYNSYKPKTLFAKNAARIVHALHPEIRLPKDVLREEEKETKVAAQTQSIP